MIMLFHRGMAVIMVMLMVAMIVAVVVLVRCVNGIAHQVCVHEGACCQVKTL
jgi:type II secretory pathway component PulK